MGECSRTTPERLRCGHGRETATHPSGGTSVQDMPRTRADRVGHAAGRDPGGEPSYCPDCDGRGWVRNSEDDE